MNEGYQPKRESGGNGEPMPPPRNPSGPPARSPTDEIRSLLWRAQYALENGWTAAANDALGRARRLL